MGLLVVEKEGLWESVVRVLREQLNEAVWFSTFADAVPVDCDEIRFVLQVPNSLARERIQSRYLQLVNEALAEVGLDIRHATVQTVGMEVVDTFYVQTAAGSPVSDRFHRAEIERALLHVVA